MVSPTNQHLPFLVVEILDLLTAWITVKVVWFRTLRACLYIILSSVFGRHTLRGCLWALDELALTGGIVELQGPPSAMQRRAMSMKLISVP